MQKENVSSLLSCVKKKVEQGQVRHKIKRLITQDGASFVCMKQERCDMRSTNVALVSVTRMSVSMTTANP